MGLAACPAPEPGRPFSIDFFCPEDLNTAMNIHKSVISGTWYPGNPRTLRREIERYVEKAEPAAVAGELAALVCPHAGYVYSGQVAAFGYKLLQGRGYEKVILLGPSHRAFFRGAAVFGEGGFETPLGIVETDGDLTARIAGAHPSIHINPDTHAQEHSLEIQLPFLQVVLGMFKFVPILMGDQGSRACEALASAIVPAMDGKTILIASSDLSHYRHYSSAAAIDKVVLERIEAMDAEGLLSDLEKGRAEACGGGPIAAAILVSKALQAVNGTVLKYANSGDVTGDRSGVVGYVSAVFSKGA